MPGSFRSIQKNGPQRMLRAKVSFVFQQLYTDMGLRWLLSCHFDA
jgi:hypothetical protein